MDKDAVKCLRAIYSDTTKEELMESEEIMIDFFGTQEKGNVILSNMNDEEWVALDA